MTKIKPKPPVREPAQVVVNKFMKEKNILLALGQPKISQTDDGLIVIGKPNIISFYKDEVASRGVKK